MLRVSRPPHPTAARAGWALLLLLAAPLAAQPEPRPPRPAIDVEVQDWLNSLPSDRIEPELDRLAGSAAATLSYQAISPGRLYRADPASQAFVFDDPAGVVRTTNYLYPPCYYAALRLPQGATVTGFVLWVVDNYPTGDFYAALHRKDVGLFAASSVMASVASFRSLDQPDAPHRPDDLRRADRQRQVRLLRRDLHAGILCRVERRLRHLRALGSRP